MGSPLITPAHSDAQPRSLPLVSTPIIFNACAQRSAVESAAMALFVNRKPVTAAAIAILQNVDLMEYKLVILIACKQSEYKM